MAYTQEQLDKLEVAIASGVQEVEYNDSHRVKYRSQKDMEALASKMKAQLSGRPVKRRRVASFSNGF